MKTITGLPAPWGNFILPFYYDPEQNMLFDWYGRWVTSPWPLIPVWRYNLFRDQKKDSFFFSYGFFVRLFYPKENIGPYPTKEFFNERGDNYDKR